MLIPTELLLHPVHRLILYSLCQLQELIRARTRLDVIRAFRLFMDKRRKRLRLFFLHWPVRITSRGLGYSFLSIQDYWKIPLFICHACYILCSGLHIIRIKTYHVSFFLLCRFSVSFIHAWFTPVVCSPCRLNIHDRHLDAHEITNSHHLTFVSL